MAKLKSRISLWRQNNSNHLCSSTTKILSETKDLWAEKPWNQKPAQGRLAKAGQESRIFNFFNSKNFIGHKP